MKTLLKGKLLGAALALGAVLNAPAVPVTFQVEMSYQITLGNFSPDTDTMEARGEFNGWTGGFALTNVPATTIYQGTYDVTSTTPGNAVAYKFVILVGGSSVSWESIGNRSFTLASSDQTLPLSYFNNAWDKAAVPVTFQVNLQVQMLAGNFDPTAGDTVEARGDFNNWNGGFTLTNSPANPSVYSGTAGAPQAPGTALGYKFVIIPATNPAAPKWENDPNRVFTQSSDPQTLPVVYFNNVTGIPIKAAALFELDMTVSLATGRFDRTNEVWVRGNLMGWGGPPGGYQLFEDTTRAGLYTNLYTIDSQITGDQLQYKFTIYNPTDFTTTWEDGNNKTVSWDGTEPTNSAGYHVKTVGPTYFNGVSPNDILTADTLVTFRVNMNGAKTYPDGTAFDPSVSGVWINGGFLPGGWNGYGTWGSQPAETKMFDDATHGDSVSGDLIYTWQMLLNKGTPRRVEYKYGIDSNDNEAGFQANHVSYVRSLGTYSVPVDTFGTQTVEPAVVTLAVTSVSGGNVNLAWSGRPGVHLQTAGSSTNPVWQDLPNTEGQSAASLPLGTGPAFYRLFAP